MQRPHRPLQCPEAPSTQYLRSPEPKYNQQYEFVTRAFRYSFRYWVLGPSETDTQPGLETDRLAGESRGPTGRRWPRELRDSVAKRRGGPRMINVERMELHVNTWFCAPARLQSRRRSERGQVRFVHVCCGSQVRCRYMHAPAHGSCTIIRAYVHSVLA